MTTGAAGPVAAPAAPAPAIPPVAALPLAVAVVPLLAGPVAADVAGPVELPVTVPFMTFGALPLVPPEPLVGAGAEGTLTAPLGPLPPPLPGPRESR